MKTVTTKNQSKIALEAYFDKFRKNIIGIEQRIQTPLHSAIPVVYADWTASGRMYSLIEDKFRNEIYPLVANTHTDTNHTGMTMTYAYHKAQQLIKKHVGATKNDILIASNSGMTGVVNKFQRILGLKVHESFLPQLQFKENEVPVVFVTHMEHHSNQTSWEETIADVVVVPPNKEGLVDIGIFKEYVQKYSSRKTKIAAITSCSNVTGIMTPYMDIAQFMHEIDGLCFVDFACSAPYVNINMHEADHEGRYLDAIYFSPHKFLGGPGSSGVLIFNKSLYKNTVPDNPGGGTVDWTNPWGEHKFISDIEVREDGGTPAFLQTIKAAMCCQLKSEMGVDNIKAREEEILDIIWEELENIHNLHILADNHKKRLGVFSFYIDGLHYNLGVKILNDRFGIQTRGGCSCAGTYGHFLLNVTQEYSKTITDMVNAGDCSTKPGWIRLSIHPTHTNNEIYFICTAIKALSINYAEWVND
ncbi:MAG: aminotransferase class V-fold PLP-dependent enzyme, partial [Croceitalea sp.]|nr:aminotransferase class V-fold PLP-dependent enzyme [Croceitalea sp.]